MTSSVFLNFVLLTEIWLHYFSEIIFVEKFATKSFLMNFRIQNEKCYQNVSRYLSFTDINRIKIFAETMFFHKNNDLCWNHENRPNSDSNFWRQTIFIRECFLSSLSKTCEYFGKTVKVVSKKAYFPYFDCLNFGYSIKFQSCRNRKYLEGWEFLKKCWPTWWADYEDRSIEII